MSMLFYILTNERKMLFKCKIIFPEVEQCYGDNDPLLNIPKEARCEPNPGGIGCVFLERMKYFRHRIAQVIYKSIFTSAILCQHVATDTVFFH